MKRRQQLILESSVQRVQRGHAAHPATHGFSRPFLYAQVGPVQAPRS